MYRRLGIRNWGYLITGETSSSQRTIGYRAAQMMYSSFILATSNTSTLLSRPPVLPTQLLAITASRPRDYLFVHIGYLYGSRDCSAIPIGQGEPLALPVLLPRIGQLQPANPAHFWFPQIGRLNIPRAVLVVQRDPLVLPARSLCSADRCLQVLGISCSFISLT